MASSALIACAQSIQDGNLKLADSLLERIWNLAAGESDKQQCKVMKYFAEALVRRAYGLHPAYFTLQLTSPLYFLCEWIDFIKSVQDAINDTVMGNKRWHLIHFYIPHLYEWGYLFPEVPNRYDNPPSVRVSVILPPFLEEIVNVQQEKQSLTEAAKETGVDLEELKVIYANGLGEVDTSILEFRRTEDEVVAVFYIHKLQMLLAESEAMKKESSKLRQIKPGIVITMEQDADLNDSNFIKRLEKSFQYYSYAKRKLL